MGLLLVAVALVVLGGVGAVALARSPSVATGMSAVSAVAGCVVGLVPTVQVLTGRVVEPIQLSWPILGGPFTVGLDRLSAFFLVPILVLSAIAAIYGREYMQAYPRDRSLGLPSCSLSLLIAGMIVVVIARHGLLFLMAWELMSLAAFFLVTFEHEKRESRRAGWMFIIAAHLGVLFLFAVFLLLGRTSASLDFAAFEQARTQGTAWTTVLVILALVGFGAKAGLVPFHVWLPDAHPAAPSHVSAIMSGVLIKTGIYGILRVMTFVGEPAAWWGPTLVVIGLGGGVLGISLAVQQRDLKRVLAYSSIENVGLITLGLGIGLWGWTSGHATMAALGLAGGLLHVWNHAAMKGLLFLAAGSVLHGTGTRDIETLGGLMKRMPRTGLAMTVGLVAIAGLPPLNGFVSEWLMYLGLMRGGLANEGISRVVLLVAVAVLSIIGALALACFVRILGVVFLGEPRSRAAEHAHESSPWMTAPLGVLGLICVVLAAAPSLLTRAIAGVAEQVVSVEAGVWDAQWQAVASGLTVLGAVQIGVCVAVAVVAVALAAIQRRAEVAEDSTWGCGYAQPTTRMQYTGSSFAQILVDGVGPGVLRSGPVVDAPRGLFPANGSFATEHHDPLTKRLYDPIFSVVTRRFARWRVLQLGNVHVYLLYVLLVVLATLAWAAVHSWTAS